MQLINLAFSLLLALSPLIQAKKSKADSAVLLSKVKSLTLYGDKKTSHRRVSAIPQLKCVGGNGCKHYNVDIMRCQNAGAEYDSEDIQWTCSASLPEEVKLGSTEVICEGYDDADDPWVLKGSCGVEYRLVLTDEGERKFGKGRSSYKSKQQEYSTIERESTEESTPLVKLLFWLAFIGIACFIIYRIFNPPNGNGPIRIGGNNRPGWGGGGGGGGDNGWDDPPPPYSPRPPTQPRAKPSSSRTSTGAWSSRNSGPGFWSGAAAGAAGGYGAGYYHGSRTAEAERRERERARERESTSSSSGGGSRAGSGGGGSFFSGSGGGSSSPSSSRHDSTGFGGTRRR